MSEQGKITASHLSRTAVIYLLSELRREFSQFRGGSWCAALRSFVMIGQDEPRDLSALAVPQAGWLEHAEDPWEPYRLRDPAGALVGPVAEFLRDLQASGRPETTLRAYATALLRWYRFLWAAGVGWDQATRAEARDFSCWIQITVKPGRAGRPGDAADAGGAARAAGVRAGVPNPVTGKAPPGRGYAPVTAAHSESVLRGFYDFHREAGTGPMVNPFPLARGRRGRVHAHHNPMEPYRGERGRCRRGGYRAR